MDKKLEMSCQRALAAQKAVQQVKGVDSAPLLCFGETPAAVLHPALAFPEQEGYGPVRMSPKEDHQDDQKTEATLL